MIWDYFYIFALSALILWISGAYFAWREKRSLACVLTLMGTLVFFSFILAMWLALERPPLRTMGETRLWYSFFLPLVGLIVYIRWRYNWILSFSMLLALVFVVINMAKPEIHSKALMPALQSPWFAPYVIVYMFAYALLGAAFLLAVVLLVKQACGGDKEISASELLVCDNLVYTGLAFLTIGMLFGALWAKEAWGHYWSWDPKETWAAITWFAYLVYVHYRRLPRHNRALALWTLVISFFLLQMCWWGINYLPSAQGTSVHTYSLSE